MTAHDTLCVEGWGEFDIAIKIHFTPDANLRPLEILHTLKLYANADTSQVASKKPVLNEIYEELYTALLSSRPHSSILQQ